MSKLPFSIFDDPLTRQPFGRFIEGGYSEFEAVDADVRFWLEEAKSMGFTDVPSSPVQGSQALEEVVAEPVLQFAHAIEPAGQRYTVGMGAQPAELMFISVGEATGECFDGQRIVGDAFDLLMAMIEKGLQRPRHEVFVSWVLHSNSHDQGMIEDDCLACLSAQIEWVSPKVVVLLGARALQLFRPDLDDLGRYRGQWVELAGRMALPTFHPEFLLRQPKAKREAWHDLQRVMERLGWS